MSSMSGFQMPAGCEACPTQCDFASQYEALEVQKALGEYSAEGLLDESLETTLASFTGDDEWAPAMAAGLRRYAAKELDDLDEELDDLQQRATSYAASCDKPLKMRASKGGKTYTASICTSALAYLINHDQPKHTSTHVWVSTPKE